MNRNLREIEFLFNRFQSINQAKFTQQLILLFMHKDGWMNSPQHSDQWLNRWRNTQKEIASSNKTQTEGAQIFKIFRYFAPVAFTHRTILPCCHISIHPSTMSSILLSCHPFFHPVTHRSISFPFWANTLEPTLSVKSSFSSTSVCAGTTCLYYFRHERSNETFCCTW